MTGPEHFAAGEENLAAAVVIETDGHDDSKSAWHQRQAQAHFTAALAAATALSMYQTMPANDSGDWIAAAGYAGQEVTR